jgi:nicotinamide-nucleotide amidase
MDSDSSAARAFESPVMQIECVFIGEELLRGAVVNSNAAYIGKALMACGWPVSAHACIADVPEEMERVLVSALERADLVVTTGGLGPTLDDRTRSTLAKIFDTDLVLKEELLSALKARYGTRDLSLENQATIPRTARALPNSIGTAFGLVLEKQMGHRKAVLIALPGVPLEMRTLFEEEVIPFLKKRFPHPKAFATDQLHLFGISESSIDPILRKLEPQYPEVQFGIYPSDGLLTLTFTAPTHEPLSKIKASVQSSFPQNWFPSKTGAIEEAIWEWMVSHRKTLALAESCTGGRVAAKLTSVPGASAYFLGSFVTYSNPFKTAFLDVSKATLSTKGAVSEETTLEMLEGVLKQTGADYGLAVTGLAGPSTADSPLPVGTFFIAAGAKGQKPHLARYCFPFGREKTQVLATNFALGLLFQVLCVSASLH